MVVTSTCTYVGPGSFGSHVPMVATSFRSDRNGTRKYQEPQGEALLYYFWLTLQRQ